MGNLCCSGIEQYQRHPKINPKIYNMIIDVIDKQIGSSGILSIIKDELQNKEIMEYTYNLYISENEHCNYQSLLYFVSEPRLLRLIVIRFLYKLRKLKVEKRGHKIIFSRKKIRNVVSSEYEISTHNIELFTNARSPYTHSSALDYNNDRFELRNSEEESLIKKGHKMILYLKIFRDIIPHQYDDDYIYQTISNHYYRIKECIICYEKPANVLYRGCMHLQVCEDCQTNRADPNYDPASEGRRNCPVCRIWSGKKGHDWITLKEDIIEKYYPIYESLF